MQKQLDKAQLQLTECRAQIRDLKLQLSDAGDCKVSMTACMLYGLRFVIDYIFRFVQHVCITVDFVGKSEENRRPRKASRRVGDVADAFFAESYRAQRTSMVESCLEFWKSEYYSNCV